MELIDFCTIKPNEELTKEKALEIKQRIDDVQNDLDFLCDWLKHEMKAANDIDMYVSSCVHGEAYQA